jgi:hypothetical protein
MAVDLVRRRRKPDEESRLIQDAVRDRVTARAPDWVPGAPPGARVVLRQLSNRPRAQMYSAYVDDGSGAPQVLAKVRRSQPGTMARAGIGRRPRLAPSTLTVPELTGLEYAGLAAMHEAFGAGRPEFGAVRPLEHLVAESTILMEYVDAPTLRDLLLTKSRAPFHRQRATEGGDSSSWRRAGLWLALFQRSLPHHDLPARQATRSEVVEQFAAYDAFLSAQLGGRRLGDAARRGAEAAAGLLPDLLPLATSHGDYATRNVFVLPDGRLSVFDPMPRWAVPRCEDLSRFLVGMSLLGLQVHSHGAAFGRRELEQRELEVIEGYRREIPVPLAELRCHQLLILLDRWSALVDVGSRGPRARSRLALVKHASGYVRGEAHRLLRLLESAG